MDEFGPRAGHMLLPWDDCHWKDSTPVCFSILSLDIDWTHNNTLVADVH